MLFNCFDISNLELCGTENHKIQWVQIVYRNRRESVIPKNNTLCTRCRCRRTIECINSIFVILIQALVSCSLASHVVCQLIPLWNNKYMKVGTGTDTRERDVCENTINENRSPRIYHWPFPKPSLWRFCIYFNYFIGRAFLAINTCGIPVLQLQYIK